MPLYNRYLIVGIIKKLESPLKEFVIVIFILSLSKPFLLRLMVPAIKILQLSRKKTASSGEAYLLSQYTSLYQHGSLDKLAVIIALATAFCVDAIPRTSSTS